MVAALVGLRALGLVLRSLLPPLLPRAVPLPQSNICDAAGLPTLLCFPPPAGMVRVPGSLQGPHPAVDYADQEHPVVLLRASGAAQGTPNPSGHLVLTRYLSRPPSLFVPLESADEPLSGRE